MEKDYQNMYNGNGGGNTPTPSGKTKICKHCKMEIDAKAKVCPHCRKKQGTSGCLIVVLVVLALFLFGVINSLAGYEKSQRGSVTIDSNGGTSEQKDSATENAQETTEDNSLSYEVTDTSFNYYTNSIGHWEYYGFVEITNTGTCNIYLDDCTFDLEDNDGHLLQSDGFISTCPDVIAPGEKGYFYNSLGSTGIDDTVSMDNGINLVPNYKITKAIGDFADFEVTDTDMREDDYGNVKITGRVTNPKTEDDGLYINVLFYDANGRVLLITGTNVSDIPAGGTSSFEVTTWFSDDSISKENIASYTVIARDNYYQW